MLGPSLSTLKLAALDVKDKEGFIQTVANALGVLVQRLSIEDLDYFEKLFSPKTWVSGETDAGIEEIGEGREPLLTARPNHFTGARQYDFFVWLFHCLMVNYAPFFDAVRTTLQPSSSAAAKQSHSNSPTDANGTIGA